MEKLISIYDYTNPKLSVQVNICVALITSLIVKLFSDDVTIYLFICITVILSIGSLVQILRKDRNVKKILYYVLGTLFGMFITYMIYIGDMYSHENNKVMLAIVIKIIIGVMALLIDIIGVIFIMNKGIEKREK
ncbi:hypothetical protein [Clostridium sp. DMHC 10]|uniref:hypothetical protein n=1 Tax=Clostridium sp. DMHC 10 TaxID=747377 RepID=UPI001A9A560B|nr:hypothetical protein [Clostridium sp. DMHC 10]